MIHPRKIGLLGAGSLGKIIGRSLLNGEIPGARLSAISELSIDIVEQSLGGEAAKLFVQDTNEFLERSDIVIEALPPDQALKWIPLALRAGKTVIALSVSVFVTHPEIFTDMNKWDGKLILPAGSIAGLDGVQALAQAGITQARIKTTKPPKSLQDAPYVKKNKVDLSALQAPLCLFSGSVSEGARYFPANVNVAAALSLSGIGPQDTLMEVWADPKAQNNKHDVFVESEIGRLNVRLENILDPQKPSSSKLAAFSVLAKCKEIP